MKNETILGYSARCIPVFSAKMRARKKKTVLLHFKSQTVPMSLIQGHVEGKEVPVDQASPAVGPPQQRTHTKTAGGCKSAEL